MEIHLKKNQVAELMFPMVDSVSPSVFKSGLAVVDTAYYKDGAGAWTSLAITDTATEIGSTGMYTLEMTAAELNHDLIMIKLTETGAADSVITIRTFDVDIEELLLPNGTVVTDGGNSATTFKTNLTEAVNDFWKDAFIKFTSGSLIEQVKKITAYNGTTKFITVQGGFTATPSASDAFDIINR